MSRSAKCLFALVASVALAGCASGLQEKLDAAQKENLDVAAENDQLKTERAKTTQQLSAASQALQVAEQQKLEAQKAAEVARQRAIELAAAQNKPSAPVVVQQPTPATAPTTTTLGNSDIEKIADQLRRELGKSVGPINVTKDGNIEIELPSDVTFGSGSAELSDAGKKSLKAIAPELKGRWAPYQIRVEGHTDSTPLARTKGKYQDNFGLGSARSLAVVRFLEGEAGIDPKRLMSASLGQHKPVVATEKTDADKRKNRRVELVVIIPHDSAQAMAK